MNCLFTECDRKSPEECQLCRDEDSLKHGLINIQEALDKAGVSDPVKREIIIKELCI